MTSWSACAAAQLNALTERVRLPQLPRIDMAALRELRVPELSDKEKRAAAAAAAGAAAVALVTALALAHRRRRRRAAAAAAEQQEEAAETLGPCGVLLDPLGTGKKAAEAEPAAATTGVITTIAGLEQLPHFRLLAAPVLAVRVTHQGEQLAAIQASVLALRELKELDLRGNAISEVPAAIGNLTALTRLCLAGNRICQLPETLGKLQALEDLDVGGNQLATLPDALGALGSLKYLNAMNNQLTALPDSIGGCSSLLRLGLRGNRLVALPASIGQLVSLVELYLTDNLLEELPATIGGMTSLVKLQASFNRLKSLPAELGSLPRLEMLRVASCQIEAVPATLSLAPKLAWMSLASNPCCRPLAPRKPPVVALNDLTMGLKVGDGASGEVFGAYYKQQRVAVKIFVAERSPDGHSRDEMAIAFSVSDKHLARVSAQLQEPLGLVMEWAEGAPMALKPNHESLLRCRWAPGQVLQLGWVLRVAIGVASALEHMHYRGIAHGDVYGHNCMASEEGHATLCDYGASFPYHKSGPVRYEAMEVRAFGLMLADMVQRLDISFQGMERLLELQKELLGVVQLCTAPSPLSRPTFGAVGRRLKAIRKQAARAGLAEVSPRGPGSETASLASLTPRTCVTEAAFSPRSPLGKAAAC
ncbi:hypothetical protein COHA_000628 [Chlorella ohadii]|uniref:Protein kinase domain-containing protein n=1 Tax=Chlorella ohadii TaxID=2649997 RepID=A0AAD5E0R6_9CHLO|nr:hypothetical protein COHA_000628 [Chlorella ohadii]